MSEGLSRGSDGGVRSAISVAHGMFSASSATRVISPAFRLRNARSFSGGRAAAKLHTTIRFNPARGATAATLA